jgi:hypothetical protein
MFVAALVMLVAVAAPVSAQVYYDGCWAYDAYWDYWYYWCDDDGDDIYWVSPDAYYVGDPSGNEPWSFYYTGEGDVSYEW